MDIQPEKKEEMRNFPDTKKWMLLQLKGTSLLVRCYIIGCEHLSYFWKQEVVDSQPENPTPRGEINVEDPNSFVESLRANPALRCAFQNEFLPLLKNHIVIYVNAWFRVVTTLKVSLTSKPLTWIDRFIKSGGIDALLTLFTNLLPRY